MPATPESTTAADFQFTIVTAFDSVAGVEFGLVRKLAA